MGARVWPDGCLCPGPVCLTNCPVAGPVYVADPAAPCRITLCQSDLQHWIPIQGGDDKKGKADTTLRSG